MDSMIIGRYLPLNFFIHKRDPRLKIGLLLLFLILCIFLMQVLLVMVFYLPMSFYVFFLSKISFKDVMKAMKPMIFMMAFSCLIQSLILTDWFCRMYSRTC